MMYEQLQLLVPWDLPSPDLAVGGEHGQLNAALDEFKSALCQDSSPATLIELNRILESVGVPESRNSSAVMRETPLELKEVAEYDRYFCIEHIESESKSLCLVRSLITTCYVFLKLCCEKPAINPKHVQHQIQGFICHATLLQRVFLDEEAQ